MRAAIATDPIDQGELRSDSRLRLGTYVACAVALALAVAPFFPPLAPARWPLGPRTVTYAFAGLAQSALYFGASRRRELGRRLRRALLLIAAGMLAVGVEDALIAFTNQQLAGPVLAHVTDYLDLASNLLGLAALFVMPLASLRRNGRWLVTIDIAVAVGGMAIVLFVTTTLTGLNVADKTEQARIIQYALITAANLVAINLILVRGLARPVPRAISFLAATVVIEIGYWVFVQLAVAKIVVDKRPLDVIFAADQVCYALAGLAFLTARVEPGRQALSPEWMRDVNPLPAMAITAVGAMLVERVWSGATAGLLPLVAGMVALSLLLVTRVIVAARDRSHLVRLELEIEQRLHADRVLAIRRLAGGIAHEFNNLMTIVIGTASEEMIDLPPHAPLRAGLESIRDAGSRAADLTARLLTYAGESKAERESIALLELLSALTPRVVALADGEVDVHIDAAPGVGTVRGERLLLEECVLHLVKNACAAMPDGGELYIRLRQKQVPRDGLAGAILPAPAGTYAVLEVRDGGQGIRLSDVQRIFDPFYTSRSHALASGLGLAVVHGAVASHGGAIEVESTAESGTAIRLYIPVEAARPAFPA